MTPFYQTGPYCQDLTKEKSEDNISVPAPYKLSDAIDSIVGKSGRRGLQIWKRLCCSSAEIAFLQPACCKSVRFLSPNLFANALLISVFLFDNKEATVL